MIWLVQPESRRGLYSPPGIPPGIRLQSRNSARLITEFDIPAESAWNIMGIVFVLLCLVIPYRVRPHSVKKKLKSMDHPVDFHGTSPRSSHEIIHVMISHARTKQTMFVWCLAHQTWPTLFFPPPPTMLITGHRHQPRSSPPPTFVTIHERQQPPTTPLPPRLPETEANHPQTKMATHIRVTASSHIRTQATTSQGE